MKCSLEVMVEGSASPPSGRDLRIVGGSHRPGNDRVSSEGGPLWLDWFPGLMLSVPLLVEKDLRDQGKVPKTSPLVSPVPLVPSSCSHSLVLLRPRGAVVGPRHLHQCCCEALCREVFASWLVLFCTIQELKTRLAVCEHVCMCVALYH